MARGLRERLIRDEVGRRDWVDFVKGAAMILIVAYHVALFLNSIGMDAAGIGRVRIVLELFPMPAFFLLSGLFHARMATWSFGDLWRRRLRQYLYLYVLWSLIRFLFYVVAPNVRSDGAGTTASDPLALLLIFIWPISSYWFIYALFVFTLVVWAFRRAPVWVLLVISGALAGLSSSGILDTGNSSLNRMTEYLFFFVIGATFHRRIYDVVEQTKPWKAIAVCVGFVGVAGVATFLPFLVRYPGVAVIGQLLAIAAGFALGFYLVRLRIFGWVSYIGVRALNIYLVHIFVIALLVVPLLLIPDIDRPLPDRGLVVLAVITAITIALSILITRYLTRISWLFVYPFGRKKRVRRAQPKPEETPRP
jgi:uncharacterized membrane protein YcfT